MDYTMTNPISRCINLNAILQLCLRGDDPTSPAVRQRCGTISGGMGIILNLLLALGKLLAGVLTASVAMTADGLNNLSDAATSVITLIGFRLAGQEADADHPFGHGRLEYVAGLVVSLAILMMGLEVGRSALDSLFHGSQAQFSPLAVGILCIAILVKLWMFWFNRCLGRRIGSSAMEATAADSLSDTLSTAVVLVSILADRFFHWKIDGFAGLLVAFFILKTGWEAAKNTLDPLLGRPMDPALAQDIDKLALGHENILGIHDLIYHDYGPGRAMMSFHAEVPADGDLLEIHDLIDHIERELKAKHHIETVIHMDPVVCDDRTAALRNQVSKLVHAIDPSLSMHDFRITAGPLHTNLIFDVLVPYGLPVSDSQIRTKLTDGIAAMSDHYFAVIQIDHSYVDGRSNH